MDIPNDPILLVDYVNTKLDSHFATLSEFCMDHELDEEELCEMLETVDYHYDEASNRFV